MIQTLSLMLMIAFTGACTQISTSNNACSMAGLYNNSYDCQSGSGTKCELAVIQSGSNNQACWQKGKVSSSPTPLYSPNPNASATPNATATPSASPVMVVSENAYYTYKLNASNGIHFKVSSVPNEQKFNVHVYSINGTAKSIDLTLTPAADLALYENTVKLMKRIYAPFNLGNPGLGNGTSAYATFSYLPYTYTNPSVWTGTQHVLYFDAMIVWIKK